MNNSKILNHNFENQVQGLHIGEPTNVSFYFEKISIQRLEKLEQRKYYISIGKVGKGINHRFT